MSNVSSSEPYISVQKPNGQPSNLPPMDEYGNLLPQLLDEPRFCKVSWGIKWIIQPFEMFKGNFLTWLAVSVILFAISIIGSYVPIIDYIFGATSIIAAAIIILICSAQFQNENLDLHQLWIKLKANLRSIVILNILFLIGLAVVFIPVLIFFSGISLTLLLDIEAIKISDFPMTPFVFSILVSLVLFLLLSMAMWFAPALIVLHGLDPKSAMKLSLKGYLANILPMIAYGLGLIIVLPFFLKITLGLGIIIAVPWIMMNCYISYRDVLTDQPLSII